MFEIRYHHLVYEKDFKKLNLKDQKRIVSTIKKKLSRDPITFGKPLVGDLKGFYRLRIDSFRVIYRVEKERIFVFVLNVALRRDFEVYLEAAKRLKLI